MAGNESLNEQREVFTKNRTFLVKYLDAEDVIDELIQEKLIGQNAAQRVFLPTSSREVSISGLDSSVSIHNQLRS